MILVLLGTNPYSFERLAQAVDNLARDTHEEIYIQLGNTDYVPKYAKFGKFFNKKEVIEKIRDARLVITQGGFGSIADCLREGKNVVAVPRMPELKESPDRQEELVREFERLGLVVAVFEISKLPESIEKSYCIGKLNIPPCTIGHIIAKYIEENI